MGVKGPIDIGEPWLIGDFLLPAVALFRSSSSLSLSSWSLVSDEVASLVVSSVVESLSVVVAAVDVLAAVSHSFSVCTSSGLTISWSGSADCGSWSSS